jgi:hypothetical protein
MRPRRYVGLYTAAWRRRYGDEFQALLEDRPPRLRDALDIARGAIDAHFSGQLPGGRSGMFMRFMGLAAIFAGVALFLAFLPSEWYVEGWGPAPAFGHILFYPLALVGAFGLHLAQTRVRPNVAWPAFIALVLGGFVGSSSVGLSMWGGGIPASDFGPFQAIGLWVGSAVMGAAVLAIGVIPRFVGLAFVVGSMLAMIGPITGDGLTSSGILTALSRLGVVIYAMGWILAGLSLQFAASVQGGSDPMTTVAQSARP